MDLREIGCEDVKLIKPARKGCSDELCECCKELQNFLDSQATITAQEKSAIYSLIL
jgi:hypothetical protein